jgi:membrane-associated phospholipid phosphatase
MARHWRFALALFCLLVVVLLGLQVMLHGPMLDVDRSTSLWWAAHRRPWLTECMLLVSAVHQTLALLAATAVLIAWCARRRDGSGLRSLLLVPAAMLLNVALKDSIRRVRPVLAEPLVHLSTYSFPSGHAVASTVFYGTVCVLVFRHTRSRRWRTVAATVMVVMVPLVAFSRVYLGAHYPSDVIAGIAVGTLCLLSWPRLARVRASPATTPSSP